ncbi:MAG: imidazoleglycerol-phosphate dehydratase, partial [Oscillospiraceae bacterium]|nr:imidazoleglycerol-phosphate dehydratase [Oscillospiraceae bacterium]
GIVRYGQILLPMDEALVQVSLDISGRGGFFGRLNIPSYRVGDFDTELVGEFFSSFTRTSAITLHIDTLAGTNSHHIIEAMFKGVARALKIAVAVDGNTKDNIPSTKGILKGI